MDSHNKPQKNEADTEALELKQQYLKERITHHIMRILDQEEVFAMDPPILFGALIDAIKKIKTLDPTSDEKARLKARGEDFLAGRVNASRKDQTV